MIKSKILLLITPLLLLGCASQQQEAYSACAAVNNNSFRFAPGAKALVSGVSPMMNTCFSRTNAGSTDIAINAAIADCRRAGFTQCFVFATDQGLPPWVQAMANNGGTDGSREAAQQALAAAAVGAAVVGGGVVAYRASQSNQRAAVVGAAPVQRSPGIVGGGGGVGGGGDCSRPELYRNGPVPACLAVCDAGCQANIRWNLQNESQQWNGGREFMNLGRP
jgi:hypothetical protein